MSLLNIIKGIKMAQVIKETLQKRSVERATRSAGAVGLTFSLIDLFPPQYKEWGLVLIPVINLVFKELRMRNPDSKWLKVIPL